jgi:hypothetical protein
MPEKRQVASHVPHRAGDVADRLLALGQGVEIAHAPGLCGARSALLNLKPTVRSSCPQDVQAKVQAVLNDLVRTYGPLDREQVTLAGIIDAIAQLPRGNPFKPRLRAIITAQKIDDVLSKADKQTRDTRTFFGLPNAIGVVIMLNEHAPLVEPDYFQDKAWDMLRKEQSPGQLRYPHDQIVILISEAHRVVTKQDREEITVETSHSHAGLKNAAVEAFAADFQARWPAFNGALASELVGPIRDVRTRDPPRLFKT